MEPIYVTGHRNPDTDSIVSAMAYAQLRTALGDREYVAARLGRISDETQLVLDRFGFEPPVLIHNLRTQVSDLNFDTPPALDKAATVDRAWQLQMETNVNSDAAQIVISSESDDRHSYDPWISQVDMIWYRQDGGYWETVGSPTTVWTGDPLLMMGPDGPYNDGSRNSFYYTFLYNELDFSTIAPPEASHFRIVVHAGATGTDPYDGTVYTHIGDVSDHIFGVYPIPSP